jgi:hypothetical protein
MTPVIRTGSGCLFAFFLFFGLILTAVFGYPLVWLPLRVHLFYLETTCIVLDKKLDEQFDADGNTSRPLIHIEYTADGRPRQVWTYDAGGVYTNLHDSNRAVLDQFEKGKRYPCWYDPANPDSAVLTRSFTWWSLMELVPLTFAAIGAGGLIYLRRTRDTAPAAPALPAPRWRDLGPVIRFVVLFVGGFLAAAACSVILFFNFAGAGLPFWQMALLFFGPFLVYTILVALAGQRLMAGLRRALPTPERAAAAAARRPPAPAPAEAEGKDAWPTVPAGSPLAPGRELAYSLASNSRPGTSLLIALGIAAFWNGIVSVFVVHVIHGFVIGQPNWFLTVFLVPFVLVGLVLLGVVLFALVYFVGSLLAGGLHLEIAAHPLLPGSSSEILVEQRGACPLGSVRVTLKCTESATYTAGTNSSTATKEVYRQDVLGPEPSLAGALRGTVTVPAGAMHSFEANHNKITWTVEVRGRVLGVLPHGCEFPVIVRPGSEGGRT